MLPSGSITVTDNPREFQWFNDTPIDRHSSICLDYDGKVCTVKFVPDIKRVEVKRGKTTHHVLSPKFEDNEVTNISLSYDQSNNQIFSFSYRDSSDNKYTNLLWFDVSENKNVTTTFNNTTMGYVILDELRKEFVNDSDILFFYVRTTDNKLCYRIQRERFQKEYELYDLSPNEEILRIGHTRDFRIQIQTRKVIGTYSFSAFIDNKRKPILDSNGLPLWKVEEVTIF